MSEIKFLNPKEKRELLDVIKKDRGKNRERNLAIICIGIYCALRVSEISQLRISDIHSSNLGPTIYCRRLKNSDNNTILIVDKDVLTALNSYLEIRSHYANSIYLFPSSQSKSGEPLSRKTMDKMMKNYAKMTSIPSEKWHMHVLKHTRAIELGESGVDIADIQWWLGHKNISNTLIYAQFTLRRQMQLYQKLQPDLLIK